METIFGYMTESDREDFMFEKNYEMIERGFAIVEMEHETRMSDIELSAMINNYTEAVLTDALTNEIALYQESVKEMWEKFKAWIKGIIDSILGRNKIDTEAINEELKQNPDKSKVKVVIAGSVKTASAFIHNVAQNVGKFFTKDSNGKRTINVPHVVGVVLAGIGSIGVAKAAITGAPDLMNAIKKSADEGQTELTAQDALEIANGVREDIGTIDNELKGMDMSEEETESAGFLRSILTSTVNFAKEWSGKITGAVRKAIGAVKKSGKDEKQGKPEGAKPEQNAQAADNGANATQESAEFTADDLEFIAESSLEETFLESASNVDDIDAIRDLVDAL